MGTRRFIAEVALSALLLGGSTLGFAALAPPAYAASPNCFGTTVSDHARHDDDFGAVVSGSARTPDGRGVADVVQLIRSGQFPDQDFANDCN